MWYSSCSRTPWDEAEVHLQLKPILAQLLPGAHCAIITSLHVLPQCIPSRNHLMSISISGPSRNPAEPEQQVGHLFCQPNGETESLTRELASLMLRKVQPVIGSARMQQGLSKLSHSRCLKCPFPPEHLTQTPAGGCTHSRAGNLACPSELRTGCLSLLYGVVEEVPGEGIHRPGSQELPWTPSVETLHLQVLLILGLEPQTKKPLSQAG